MSPRIQFKLSHYRFFASWDEFYVRSQPGSIVNSRPRSNGSRSNGRARKVRSRVSGLLLIREWPHVLAYNPVDLYRNRKERDQSVSTRRH